MPEQAQFRRPVWLYAAIAAVTALFYYPALHSPFLLDDLQNLGDLSRVGRTTVFIR